MTFDEYKKQRLEEIEKELECMKNLKDYIDEVGKSYAYAILEGHISGLENILRLEDEKAPKIH